MHQVGGGKGLHLWYVKGDSPVGSNRTIETMDHSLFLESTCTETNGHVPSTVGRLENRESTLKDTLVSNCEVGGVKGCTCRLYRNGPRTLHPFPFLPFLPFLERVSNNPDSWTPSVVCPLRTRTV